ncbi:MAG TPA: MBOAT family O-acyltransferase [Planctomycetota bacterium]|nr:MBOAT family O-acyltransferase [Planctomycetota bacterium]
MSFASLEYLPFLAFVVGAFAFVPARLRAAFLLVASAWFYADAGTVACAVLAAQTAIGYASGLVLARVSSARARRIVLAASVACLLGVLAAFKYAHVGPLPLGISFYTFAVLGSVADVSRRTIAPVRDPIEYALFVAFFPVLVCGPIERVGHLLPQLRSLRQLALDDVSVGARRIVCGLVKKLVVAERLGAFALPIAARPDDRSSLELALGSVAMLGYLYADFSAYTDIARGSARLFGVELLLNFRRPLLSTTLVEFWQRWHVTLVDWIRDYVYSPLAGRRLTHASIWRNNLLALSLVGLWHGASAKYLAWGLLNGALVSAYHSARLARVRVPRGIPGWALTMAIASALIVAFFTADLASAGRYFARLASMEGGGDPIPLAVPALLLGGLAVQLVAARVDLERVWSRAGALGRSAALAGGVASLALWGASGSGAFVYFAF